MKKRDSGGTLLVVLMVVMTLLLCCSFVGIYLMIIQAVELSDEVSEQEDRTSTTSKCIGVTGRYYGELVNTNLYVKETYEFSEDGSYINYVENGGTINGSYRVTNGIIYFTQKNGLGSEQKTNTYSYEVSDDCKTIYASSGGQQYELNFMND